MSSQSFNNTPSTPELIERKNDADQEIRELEDLVCKWYTEAKDLFEENDNLRTKIGQLNLMMGVVELANDELKAVNIMLHSKVNSLEIESSTWYGEAKELSAENETLSAIVDELTAENTEFRDMIDNYNTPHQWVLVSCIACAFVAGVTLSMVCHF